ncbi:C40 family peptidase [Arthrobacter ramosus]|uniref:C40 family peptidase n=1 Tax=Arthrobacter ramosus TaxID=1672 RepID=A0ABV5XVR5_ARTRM|nr:C40 family peptidase [Arthrobacter ramosus]
MPVPAVLTGLAKRRAILRASTAAVMALTLICALAFCAGVAVFAANSATTAGTCSLGAIADGQPPSDGTSGLEIQPHSEAPATLTPAQVSVARTYIAVGKQMGVPRDGQIIAIMMALQESGLRVLANTNVPSSLLFRHDGVGSDHDSLGTAQQRPAAGWGTVEQLMDPSYDARAFYGGPSGPNHGTPPGLLDVPAWQSMDRGRAAQAVQVSAFPELYARWEPEATAIVGALAGGTAPASCDNRPSNSALPDRPTSLSQIRKDILNFAQEGLGGAYVWGGAAFKAWDCSGYVQWIYRQVGINLPRVDQWTIGHKTDSPQPGDLVVQNPQGSNNWGHVGIYAGNGMMYSALNPAAGTLLHPVDWNTGTAYFDLTH